jgi:hypothetical protein
VAEKSNEKSEESKGNQESSDQTKDSQGPRLSGAQLAQHARKELAGITGLEAESVTSLTRADDGGWTVRVELLELSRIPNTDDMLGTYEADMDENGELVGYRRIRRYSRSQSDGQGQPGG